MGFDPEFTTSDSRVALSMRHACILVAILSVSCPGQVVAQSLPTCDYSLQSDSAVVIDANTGNILSSRVRFADGDAVDLTIVHKNPYAYKYSYDIKGVSVDAATIREFLELIGALQAQEPETDDQTKKGRGIGPASILDACTILTQDEMTTVIEVGTARDGLSTILAASVSTLKSKTEAFDKSVNALNKAKPADINTCEDLRNRGATLLTLGGEISVAGKTVSDTLTELVNQKKKLDGTVSPAKRQEMISDDACKDARGVVTAIATALDQNIDVANQAKNEMTAKTPQLNSIAALITKIHSEPQAFVLIRKIGPVDEATDFDIKIVRTNRADSDDRSTVAASSKIRLGTPAVSYSVGASFGFSDQAEYGRVPSVSGTGEVISIVGVTESSDTQIGLAGQLNVRIGDVFGKSSWGWALGAAISQSADGAQLGLYTGPYIAVSKRMYLTGAYHSFEETSLAGEFEVGDVVPDDLQGEIPTTKKTTGAFILTLTYDFK